MEDKTFELLTRMYNEFLGKFDNLENRFDSLESKVDKIDTRLTKVETCIENEIKPNIKACLEGYQMVYDKLIEQEKAIEIINNKLDKHDVEITVIKGSKKEVL